MGFGSMMKDAKKPNVDGFPFGSFLVEHRQLEITKEKNGKGQYQDYWTWHMMLVKRRHESAQATDGVIVKLRRDFASDFGIGDNTALAASFANKTFEDFQGLKGEEIDTYIANLQDEKASLEKRRQIVLEVTPDAKGYRRFHAYRLEDAPTNPFVFDPAMVAVRPAKDGTTAATEAGKGTAAAPPASTL